MASKNSLNLKTLLAWIAEYGCRHLIDDITKDLLPKILDAPASDLPPLSVKQTLIMHCVVNDVKGLYGEAISALNTLHTQAEEYDCLQLYLQLALGLRLKDFIHCLSLPILKYQEKVDSFTSEQYLLPRKQLKQIFSVEELLGFKMALPDICNYFTYARHDEKEIQKLKETVGKSLTETLKSVGKLFFYQLQSKQPLCTLDQIVVAGKLSHLTKCSTKWDRLLVKHLSGISVLDSDTVCRLLMDTGRLTGNNSGPQGSETSVSQVPSSQQEDEEETNAEAKRKCVFNTPNIKKFMKASDVRGCLVLLTKADS